MTNKQIFSDVKSFGLVFIPFNWLICIIVTLILVFTTDTEYWLGYILGSMTSFLTFGMLMKNVNGLGMEKKSAFKKAITGFTFRMIVTLVMILVAYFTDGISFLTTIIGISVLKINLYLFVLIRHLFLKDKEEIS